ncbi:MAG: hypothetical protein GXY07_08120 [Candidatus Hydrogenedentes bacterium]|nr:hypothetical protein [Candidatus Hydrogenedentota bacterium]
MGGSEDSSFYSGLAFYLVLFGIMIGAYVYSKFKENKKWERIRRAKDDIDLIRNAIHSYYLHYKRYPILNKDSDEQQDVKLFYVLHGRNTLFGKPFDESKSYLYLSRDPWVPELNPDMINFSGKFENSFPIDPWGNPYNIYITRNNNKVVELRIHKTHEMNGRLREERIIRVGNPIAIWSNGPDGINSYGEGDDIKSW